MKELIKVECPVCHRVLWVSPGGEVIKHEKSRKKKEVSFSELIHKEKEKKEKVDQTFLLAKELESKKKREAAELFKKSFENNEIK